MYQVKVQCLCQNAENNEELLMLLSYSLHSGLGADKSNEDNWLSHQLEFDDLLSRLNDHSENGDGEFPSPGVL